MAEPYGFHDVVRDVRESIRRGVRNAATPKKEPQTERIIWTGTDYELAKLILDAYANNQIKATGRMHALEQACGHFVKRTGKKFNARNLLQGARNQEDLPTRKRR